MIVIVEGPDGSGKSTLVERLSDEAPEGTHIRHWGPVDDPMREYTDEILTSARTHDNALYDRFWPSEYAYGTVLRGETRVGAYGRAALFNLASKYHDVRVVMCLPPVEVVRANIAWRGEDSDMRGVRANIDALYRAYGFYPAHRMHVTEYDYTADTPPTWETLRRCA